MFTAALLGYRALAITDVNTLAGVVRVRRGPQDPRVPPRRRRPGSCSTTARPTCSSGPPIAPPTAASAACSPSAAAAPRGVPPAARRLPRPQRRPAGGRRAGGSRFRRRTRRNAGARRRLRGRTASITSHHDATGPHDVAAATHDTASETGRRAGIARARRPAHTMIGTRAARHAASPRGDTRRAGTSAQFPDRRPARRRSRRRPSLSPRRRARRLASPVAASPALRSRPAFPRATPPPCGLLGTRLGDRLSLAACALRAGPDDASRAPPARADRRVRHPAYRHERRPLPRPRPAATPGRADVRPPRVQGRRGGPAAVRQRRAVPQGPGADVPPVHAPPRRHPPGDRGGGGARSTWGSSSTSTPTSSSRPAAPAATTSPPSRGPARPTAIRRACRRGPPAGGGGAGGAIRAVEVQARTSSPSTTSSATRRSRGILCRGRWSAANSASAAASASRRSTRPSTTCCSPASSARPATSRPTSTSTSSTSARGDQYVYEVHPRPRRHDRHRHHLPRGASATSARHGPAARPRRRGSPSARLVGPRHAARRPPARVRRRPRRPGVRDLVAITGQLLGFPATSASTPAAW